MEHLETVYSSDYAEHRKIDLFLPESPNGACLFFIHGGGWSAGNKQQWHGVAKYFCERGYVCASAGYRLAPDYVFPSQLEDVRLAMQFVKQQAGRYGYAPDAVAVVGSSAGGHLAAMLATVPEDDPLGATAELTNADTVPRAAICYCPVTTLFIKRDFVNVFMAATAEAEPELFRTASPVHRVHRMKGGLPPFLFIQGDNDPTTTLADTSEMCHRINASGGNADLIVLPGVKHGFGYGTDTPAQRLSVRHIELFLQKHGL
ncbi:alpha/beta hydrolase [Paenibacillus allorhizosphaerae]|uniref:Acetylxylan esterase n=1 Tax=Paenibacillus allorhizosphaerae TaxID=2849866 RepID=A0ABM8VBX6_9BACL|nr:alpha/beta hydrolase [Paenibacillus allorhizosphaerae]CAG7618943.1 Acetylxylan esterase [Paenibacillus allorhizosphaerae]